MMHHANQLVMPGLDPGIHGSATGAAVRGKDVHGRDRPGHAECKSYVCVPALAVCCSCSKSAAKSPASFAVFVDPLEIDGSALPNRSHPPVPPVLSGRDQASPNSLIEIL